MVRLRRYVLIALLLAGVSLPAVRSEATQDLLFGGGAVTGVYFKVVLYACNIVNKVTDGDYNCVGRPALGSVFNINAVSRGLLDFAVAQ